MISHHNVELLIVRQNIFALKDYQECKEKPFLNLRKFCHFFFTEKNLNSNFESV